MKTVLVTGAAGFIGSHTSLSLLKLGHKVVGLDNLNDYYNPDWKLQNLAELKDFPEFTFIKGDITNQNDINSVLNSNPIDLVIHLAARAGVRPSIKDPILYEQVNVFGTLQLLEAVRNHNIKHFIYASSSSVYGNQVSVPFKEADPVNQPISPYAATKKSGEMLMHTYAHLYDIKTTCLRFFTVYGPKGRPDMAPFLFTKAILSGNPITKFGDGTTQRDYTYIDDIVTGIISATQTPFKFEIINLGNNKPISLNSFIQTIEQATNKKAIIKQAPMQPGDVNCTYADITKAQKLLGFNPSTTFESGIANFVTWFKQHRL